MKMQFMIGISDTCIPHHENMWIQCVRGPWMHQ